MKKKLKNLALFLEQLRSHFICIEYVQIDNVEEQRKIKEDLIQNTEEVEKVLAIREEMDAKQELKSKYAKRSVETTSGVERLQLRVAIEKLEEEVYELREMLLQQVIENLGLDETYSSLKKKVTLNNPSNSRILEITVRDANPSMAKKIADEIARVSVAFIQQKMDQDAPNIIQKGYSDGEPVSPNTMKNTVIGGILGMYPISD